MKKSFNDPAFHFLLLSVGIFLLFYAAPREAVPVVEEHDYDITLTSSDADRLVQQFAATWQRNPTAEELQSFVEESVREQILVREAKALGLDKSDTAINARLIQKFRFLTESLVQELKPDDAELQSYYEAEKGSFEVPGSKSFEQVYLGERVTQATVDETLDALNSGAPSQEWGVATMLPPSVTDAVEHQIDGQFGRDFFASLQSAAEDRWVGPIQSGFGYHLVKVTEGRPASVPPLQDIRDEVVTEWKREKSVELVQTQYANYKEQYNITVPSKDELLEVLKK